MTHYAKRKVLLIVSPERGDWSRDVKFSITVALAS